MSPIIATILLVAITVVLAAVLYVLISGLTRGPGNTPIGSAFGMASPTAETGAASNGPVGCAATAGEVCYTIQIASASSGLTWNSLQFVVHTSAGNPATLGAGAKVSVVGTSGTVAFTCSIGVTCASTTAVSTGQVIVFDSGLTTSVSGDSLVANGQGSYSSSTAITLP